MKRFIFGAVISTAVTLTFAASAQSVNQTKGNFEDKFRQLEEVLPTPNVYRAGSGAPGHKYWQQKVDYKIKVTLTDTDDAQVISGSQIVTYTNNSPDTLDYLWVQMDQNRFSKHSEDYRTRTSSSTTKLSMGALRSALLTEANEGGYKISKLTTMKGVELPHTVADTIMRIDLPKPLKPGATFKFNMDWSYNIVEGNGQGARGGKEKWEDGQHVYFISQWYPRLSAYTDTEGWSTKQFLGRGEFTLEFGDYDVEITVPADHIVSSTGELKNPKQVLTKTQIARLKKAETAERPMFIVTPDEALENEKEGTDKTATWRFTAKNVRDFAFASSRKFVWDAQGYQRKEEPGTVMAMSFYPNEGMPLWDKYSTEAIVHTLETYSKYTFDYPYPTSQSVLGPISGGMEYPMITSNGPRTEKGKDGKRTYTRRAKYGLISVVIHEVGHNWFPMIVDTDERNWTWMDEGLNSFLQTLSEREWERNYPGRRIEPRYITNYMTSEHQVPIMTQSESILQFGNNAYAKPAAALNILRETVMGRELFDFAFKTYSNRWKFKRPYPADFFRSMEDAGGIDLDWFWRGWFYSTDHVEMSIDRVVKASVGKQTPDEEANWKRDRKDEREKWTGLVPTDGINYRTDRFPELLDFYNENDEFTVTDGDRKKYEGVLKGLKDWER